MPKRVTAGEAERAGNGRAAAARARRAESTRCDRLENHAVIGTRRLPEARSKEDAGSLTSVGRCGRDGTRDGYATAPPCRFTTPPQSDRARLPRRRLPEPTRAGRIPGTPLPPPRLTPVWSKQRRDHPARRAAGRRALPVGSRRPMARRDGSAAGRIARRPYPTTPEPRRVTRRARARRSRSGRTARRKAEATAWLPTRGRSPAAFERADRRGARIRASRSRRAPWVVEGFR